MKDREIIVESLRVAVSSVLHRTPDEAVDWALMDVAKGRASLLRADMFKLLRLYNVRTFADLRHCFEAQQRALATQVEPVRAGAPGTGSGGRFQG